jgi:hypothetical protein
VEALEPIVKFRSNKMFDNGAIREFYSLLRTAMMGARKVGLLHRLINDQTLLSILAKMPPNDWCQWARERPVWMREAIEEAFWGFVDQKWRDALNVAAAEPAGGGRVATHEADKKGQAEAARKLAQAAIHVTAADERPPQQGDGGRQCIFADVLGCSGSHPPWKCRRFGNIRPKEREKIIEDNQLCAFCLLHDRAKMCGAKERQNNPVCYAPGCKGRHIRKLHEFLKDMYEEENRVHLVQGHNEWEEPEGSWAVDEAEEEAMIVSTVQQVESGWHETGDSWLELDGGEASRAYCVGACRGGSDQTPEIGVGQPHETSHLPEEEEIMEAGWWSPDPREGCRSVRGRRSTSSISSWVALQRLKAGLNRHGHQQPVAQQATRPGGGEQRNRRPRAKEEFRRMNQPWIKDPRGQRSREKREEARRPPEGRPSLALGRKGRRRTHGAEKSQRGGAPGGRAAGKKRDQPTHSKAQGQETGVT